MRIEIEKITCDAPSRKIGWTWTSGMPAIMEEEMQYKDSWIMRSYVRAWRMWNTWLVATERPEVEIEDFIEQGFTVVDNQFGSLRVGQTGYVIGQDNGYDVEITPDTIHISFKGKPRYTWHPCVPQMGNLKHDDDQECRVCERSWLQPEEPDRQTE